MDNSWAAPGVRCVCINAEWDELRCGLPTRVPMIGEVLTVKAVKLGAGGVLGGDPDTAYLVFWEIEELQQAGGVAALIGWNAGQFEPLVEQATDISVLTSLLQTAREPANV